MTEEIIINGVNVAECEFYFQDEKYSCNLSFINQEELCKCDDVQDCYYKQLKRLEQLKNKYYQQTLDDEIQINNLLEEIQQIKQDRNVENITRLSLENRRLEQERDELKKTIENQKLEYEELQCDLSEVENACGCYQSENAELKQENKDLKKQIESDKGLITIGGKQQYDMTMAYDKCKSALEEIREILQKPDLPTVDEDNLMTATELLLVVDANRRTKLMNIQDRINEVLSNDGN